MTVDISTNTIENVRTISAYMSILGLKSKSTQKLFQSTINNIEAFGKFDLKNISKYDTDNIYDILQEWILWNNKRNITASSIRCYFNIFKSYLWYQKIKLDWKDIRHNIKFPQILYENKIPMTTNIIQKILCASNREFRFQLLALLSSGMRISELGQIKLKHLDFKYSNIMVHIPAEITKTGRSRITFFSNQVSNMIKYRIKSNRYEFTFCGNRTQNQSLNLILKRFAVARKKSQIIEKYSHCKQNRYHIHVHSMRAYFITKANKVQFGLGHIFAGHNFYMKEYNLYTIDELYELYKKFEKDVTF